MNNAKIVKCNGEAHSNPFIDNCMVCLPYWKNIPVCDAGHKLQQSSGRAPYYCRTCRKFYGEASEE